MPSTSSVHSNLLSKSSASYTESALCKQTDLLSRRKKMGNLGKTTLGRTATSEILFIFSGNTMSPPPIPLIPKSKKSCSNIADHLFCDMRKLHTCISCCNHKDTLWELGYSLRIKFSKFIARCTSLCFVYVVGCQWRFNRIIKYFSNLFSFYQIILKTALQLIG